MSIVPVIRPHPLLGFSGCPLSSPGDPGWYLSFALAQSFLWFPTVSYPMTSSRPEAPQEALWRAPRPLRPAGLQGAAGVNTARPIRISGTIRAAGKRGFRRGFLWFCKKHPGAPDKETASPPRPLPPVEAASSTQVSFCCQCGAEKENGREISQWQTPGSGGETPTKRAAALQSRKKAHNEKPGCAKARVQASLRWGKYGISMYFSKI